MQEPKSSPFELIQKLPLVAKISIVVGLIIALTLSIVYSNYYRKEDQKRTASALDLSLGRKAIPKVQFKTVDGKTVGLEQFKGKVVLLSFWATWCGPCLEELPSFQKLVSQLKSNDLAVVAINVDDESAESKEFKKFWEREKLSFPNYFDSEKTAAAKLDVQSIPTNLVIDKNGNLTFLASGSQDWSETSTVDLIKEMLGEVN